MILVTLLALGLPILLYGIYAYLRSLRQFFAEIPSIKRDFFWGNMRVITKYLKPDRHPGMLPTVAPSPPSKVVLWNVPSSESTEVQFMSLSTFALVSSISYLIQS